jgi:hypothetical protein
MNCWLCTLPEVPLCTNCTRYGLISMVGLVLGTERRNPFSPCVCGGGVVEWTYGSQKASSGFALSVLFLAKLHSEVTQRNKLQLFILVISLSGLKYVGQLMIYFYQCTALVRVF